MKQKKITSDILIRIQDAEKEKDWGELSDIIDNTTEDNYILLIPLIKDYIYHKEWLIRASAVEFIGFFQIKKLLYLVKACLEDKNPLVRDYALMACYDLLKKDSLPIIEKYCIHKNVMNRITALILHYIESNDEDSFEKLSKILKRKRCNPLNLSGILRTFDYCFDSSHKNKIFKLYLSILPNLPKSNWVVKDLKTLLRGGN